jgi:hypothetical protein
MGLTTFASASPFASFRKKLTAADKDEEKEKDEDKSKKSKAEDDDKKKDDDEDKSKKSKAEDDDKKKDDDEDKSKKSKAEDEDEEKDKDKDKDKDKSKKSEDDDEEPEARSRASERARIKAIIESEPGQANVEAAYELAVNSDLPAANAIAILKSVGPKSSAVAGDASLRERMAGTQQPDIGASDARPDPNLAERIVIAGKKRRGEAT